MTDVPEGTRRAHPIIVPLPCDPRRVHVAIAPMVRCDECGLLHEGWAFEAMCRHFTEGKLVEAMAPEHDFGRYSEGAIYWRPLEDGCEVLVYPMTYGKARLCYGEQGYGGGILDGFCYQDPGLAILAAETWNGEGDPLDGWHRNPLTGRRRENGDPAKEIVRA